ncbi:MAG TPA: glycosyl hydrolase 108 family protein [Terracidiphilus sp.]
MSAFEQAFEIVIGHEGKYSDNSRDPGNWTGGQTGRGQLRGTQYGISAASYPKLDIASLTLDDARALFKADYWDRLHCDEMDPGLALVAFDASVNNGVGAAIKWLQAAVRVKVDGVFGDVTLAAVQIANPVETLVELHAARINMMAKLPTWQTFGAGWSRRLARIPYEAGKMEPD